jgi:hypothetical protein
MNHLCCPACRVRFGPGSSPAPCPTCGATLAALSPAAALGYTLAEPAHPGWRPADLDALADAVAAVLSIPHPPL